MANSDDAIRAWPGGSRFAKIDPNYGPALHAQEKASKQGFDQVLWLFGPQNEATEAGGANFFAAIKDSLGRVEMITAPRDDKTILAGNTRQNVLELASTRMTRHAQTPDHNSATSPASVAVRPLTMQEMVQASDQGCLLQAFAVGTACYIIPVTSIDF